MTGLVTVFESGSPLAKHYSLRSDGGLDKTTAAQMVRGTYRMASFQSAVGLAALVDSLGTSEALCSSLPLNGQDTGTVVTQKMLSRHAGAVARTKRYFGLQAKQGLGFLDHDGGGLSRDDLWRLICAAVPALAEAGVVYRPSGSSHICHGEHDLTGLRGQHLYYCLQDASDGPRVLKVLAARLWLMGHGTVEVSKSGALLTRCPIDTAPSDAARLIFCGGALADPPLQQRRGASVVLNDGGFIDTRSLVPDLTAQEEDKHRALVAQAKASKMPEAMERRAAHRADEVARRIPALMKAGASAFEAEQRIASAVDAAFGGTLLADFELQLVHEDGRSEMATVAEVLADRLRYDGCDCKDPLFPEHRGGAADARLYLLGSSPIVFSFNDGGSVYRLRTARQRLVVNRGSRGELVQQLAQTVAGLEGVFRGDAGPVFVSADGRQSLISVESLVNLLDSEVELVTYQKERPVPTDIQRETAQLVLASLRA